MSSKNDESSGMIMVLALIGTGIMLMAMVVLVIFAVMAFVFTVLSLCAWSKPLTIGKVTIEPSEARAFVGRGLVGAIAAPVCLVVLSALFNVHINGQYLPHIIILGYSLGSLGVEILMAQQDKQNGEPDIIPPSVQIVSPSRKPVARSPEEHPFRFASWNDEEERE
ncbi:hypothetical protein C8J38_10835 [Rhizobium sp. PP-WC-2G-219]|nr:hypothetical protein C8J38_10835 [Rhizobium sp. PP-WC-2G-219]